MPFLNTHQFTKFYDPTYIVLPYETEWQPCYLCSKEVQNCHNWTLPMACYSCTFHKHQLLIILMKVAGKRRKTDMDGQQP